MPLSAQADPAALPIPLTIGSKPFTENRLFGEIVTRWLDEDPRYSVEHRSGLGGSMICWEALLAGELDLYVEYSGTGYAVILGETDPPGDALKTFQTVQRLSEVRHGVRWLGALGVNNTYAMAVRREVAEARGLTRLSDLIGLDPPLKAGFSIEFVDRADGWRGLQEAYPGMGVEVRSMEHALAYEGLEAGAIAMLDGYATDAKLRSPDIVVLEDDRAFFPPYHAAPVLRAETLESVPGLRARLGALAYALDDETMRRLNHEVEIGGRSFEQVAESWLHEAGLLGELASPVRSAAAVPRADRPWYYVLVHEPERWLSLVLQHLALVGAALLLAIALAVPLGILSEGHPTAERVVLGFSGLMQTVPSLALLAILIALPGFGLGVITAGTALVLYALLPIVRNTLTGLRALDPELLEVGRGIGLSERQLLWKVRLPLALRTILAGIRTATVTTVGVATLAAFIGAGGLGGPILEGLYLNDTSLIFAGAVPAAVLALTSDALLGVLERRLTPRGLVEER